MFALSGIGIVLPLENKMKNPRSMGGLFGVLSTAMSFVCSLYIAVGFFGYLVYGDLTRNCGSVTLNLPKDELLANSARIVSSLAILLTNPLQFYIAISIIIPNVVAPRVRPNRHVLAEFLLRYLLILICCKTFKFELRSYSRLRGCFNPQLGWQHWFQDWTFSSH